MNRMCGLGIRVLNCKSLMVVVFALLVVLLLPAVCPAQTPQFHSDCGAGMLLANGSCQPIEVVLAAQGGRVFWVSQANGNDGNLGTRSQPWKTIARATQELLPADAVIVRAGIYREEILPPRGGSAINRRITYAAYTGEQVIVSGADVLSNWTQSGNAWRTSWTVSLCATEATDGNIFRREMVIADGTLLRAVYTRAEVVPGTFFVEGTSCAPTAIYMRLPGDVAPTGHLLEAAKRSQLFSPEPGDGWFRLIGFTFRHAANAAREPSVKPGSQGSLIEENTVEWTNGFGMATSGVNNVFRGNRVNDNGQLGIGGSCSSCLLEYNQTNRNNWKHFNVSWEAGAMKFSRTSDTTLRYHEAGDNYGNGIWFDGQNTNNVIEQSIAYRNLQSNIFLEAHTEGTIVRNNVSFGSTVYVTGNYHIGGAGMIIYRSPNNTIVNNTFFGNGQMGLWIENNRTGEWLANGAEGYNKIYNNIFVKNGTEIRFDAENQTDARTTKFDGNLYWHPTTGTLFRLNYPGVTTYSGNDLQRWQQLLNSDFQARVADPLLENLTSSSGWHLTAGSPARVMGVAPPAPVPNDHEGDLRPASNADVGADEYNLSQTNSPPTVSLTAPSNGQSFSAPANVVLTAAAADSDGTVSKVQFYNGTTLLGTATTSPYQFTWSNVPTGTYTLTAKATDDAGATSSSNPISISVNSASNISPAVTIITPENGANFIGGANITVNAAASDTDGNVSKVEFFNGTTLIGSDTTSPYQMTWNAVSAGNYSLKAKATDNVGASSWSPSISVVVTSDFKAKINFQPTSSVVPTGYVPDSGTAYGNRGNGYSYGWNAINSSNAFDRNASNSPDQRYDTFVRMQVGGTFTWEIAVPNGTYNVRIVAGDPTYYALAFYKINVEGVLTVNGAPLNQNRWIEGTSTVTVSDGKLTVSNASGSSNNKICFIEISRVSP